MYEPPRLTLQDGLRAAGFNVVTEFFPREEVTYPKKTGLIHSISKGDIFVWLGEAGMEKVDWAALRRLGLYVIYYQSEPIHDCVLDRNSVDEMWDFSLGNIEKCRSNPAAPKLRYIPLANHDGKPQIELRRERTHSVSARKTSLAFFGKRRSRPCWDNLTKLALSDGSKMADHLSETYNAWDDTSYGRLLADAFDADGFTIWLNLHKGCGTPDYARPVTWRNPKLLGSGALIISDRCYDSDESDYKGMIRFVDGIEGIRDEYQRLSAMPASELVTLSREATRLFKARFRAADIFKRANVTSMLAQGGRTSQLTPGTW